MTRHTYPESSDPVTCGHCGFTSGIDDFDCGGLPDGMVFCPQCLSIVEFASGVVVADEDLELRMHELESD